MNFSSVSFIWLYNKGPVIIWRGGGGGEGKARRLKTILAQKLWPSPVNSLKNCGPPQIWVQKVVALPTKREAEKICS